LEGEKDKGEKKELKKERKEEEKINQAEMCTSHYQFKTQW
jgi:hypothetical protein